MLEERQRNNLSYISLAQASANRKLKNYFFNQILFFSRILPQFNLSLRTIFAIVAVFSLLSTVPVLAGKKNDLIAFGGRVYQRAIFSYRDFSFYIFSQLAETTASLSKSISSFTNKFNH